MIYKIISLCAAVLLSFTMAIGQNEADTLEQRTSSAPVGGKWTSSGSFTSFLSAGQTGVATQLLSDSLGWSGSVGFIPPVFDLRENHAPIAITSQRAPLIDLTVAIQLEGFDPDGDPIEIVIEESPVNGDLEPGQQFGEFFFKPTPGLAPETIYLDSIVFKVAEIDGGLSSEPATFRFRFQLEDQEHQIVAASFEDLNGEEGNLYFEWEDPFVNKFYDIKVFYFEPINNVPFPKEFFNVELPKEEFTIEGNILSYNVSANVSDHAYLFSGEEVPFYMVISTRNGNADDEVFIYNDNSSGRSNASEDGKFFAFGSEMSVTENKQVTLSLIAFELGDFDLTNATVEILSEGTQGTITVPVEADLNSNLKKWTLTYTSTEQVGGNDEIEFRVYNPERQEFDTAVAKIQIVDVNDPPKITRIADQITQEESPLTVNLSYEDPDSEVEILVESNEASSVPVSYANGEILISPATDFSGLVSVNVVITELNTEESYVAFDRFDVQVEAVNDPPVVAAIASQTILEDNSLTLVLSATDVDAELPVFDYSATVDKPSLIDFVIDGNNVTITPKPNVNGTFQVSVFADDRLGTATSKSEAETFQLEVTAVNDAPEVLKPFKSQRIVEGFPDYNINLKAYFNDVENGSDLNYTATGNTKVGLTFDGTTMVVAPADDFTEAEDVTITASDGELSVSSQVTFVPVIESANIVVANEPSDLSLDEDFGTETVDISNVFVDNNNPDAVFAYEILGNNFLGVEIDDSGIVTLKSEPEFSGTESLFLVGTVGDQSKFANFDVEVTAVNDAPELASIPAQIMQEDLPLSNLFIEASDIDNDFGDLQMSATSDNQLLIADNDILFGSTTGGFLMTITPEANQFGQAVINVILSDGIDSTQTSFNVNVQSVNDVPSIIVESLSSTDEDETFLLDVTTLFSDPDNDVLTYTVTEIPGWASFSDDLISGTPGNDDVGSWVMTVKADDGNSGIATASYELTVNNVNDAPEIVTQIADITVFQENSWSFNFPRTAFKDVDAGESLTYSFKQVPSWATVNGETVSGTPQYEDLGEYTMILEVTDAAGAKVSDEVKVTVQFTVYDVTVTVSGTEQCSGGRYTVVGDGAETYNWYDADDNLIAANQAQLELTDAGTYFVEGVDSEGRTTPEKVSFELAICLSAEDLMKVAIYPNPSSELVTITGINESFNFKLYDAMGRSYYIKTKMESNRAQLDISSLDEGLYFIRYELDGESHVQKIMKVD